MKLTVRKMLRINNSLIALTYPPQGDHARNGSPTIPGALLSMFAENSVQRMRNGLNR